MKILMQLINALSLRLCKQRVLNPVKKPSFGYNWEQDIKEGIFDKLLILYLKAINQELFQYNSE